MQLIVPESFIFSYHVQVFVCVNRVRLQVSFLANKAGRQAGTLYF